MTGITAVAVAGFTRGLLAAEYDNPKPIPPFHYEMWEACCSDAPRVAIAAPRKHAKSTSITHAYLLAMMLFGGKKFCLLVSDTEGQAAELLTGIKAELEGNAALRTEFGVKRLLKDTETNIIVLMDDGRKFRIQAKGSEQKVRGIKWLNQRPDLIIGDDLENDEIVMNPERREKFRKWFMNALLPCGSDDCLVRIVGTILHLDSMLNRRMNDDTWKHLFYEAEDGNFKDILWPEKFSEEALRDIYAGYLADDNPEGYSQEYRNQPVDIKTAFFKKDYFLDFERDSDGKAMLPNLEYFAAADFAISEKQKADYTAIVIIGVAPDSNMYVVDVRRFKGDTKDIIDELISTQKMWKVNMWTFESGQISKSLEPYLITEMGRTKVYLNYVTHTPTQSKTMRARSIQGKHKSGFIRYDKEKEWYPAFEAELMMVADSGPRGRNDDQFDAFAYVGLTIDQFFEAYSDEEIEEEAYQEEYELYYDQGINAVTGY